MKDMSETEDQKEQPKYKQAQFPAGEESAFLSSGDADKKSFNVRKVEGSAEQPDCSLDTHQHDGESTLASHRMDAMVGTVLANRYELKSFIGQGGMSVVYKAVDKQLNKTVAVKLLLPHLVHDPITFQRFQQEARAASSLSHTNIVGIYDFGASEDNEPYIVMDFLDGTPLNEAIKMLRGLVLERSVAIFVQIADALQCAHTNNVLHRDLKPSNVLLIHQGLLDVVKIVDFGIAKLIPQDGGESLHLTKTGEVFGSPFYMSPEQCRGEKVDARSDIYSMGCLMYEVIAGKPPIVGGNLMETLYKQLSEVPQSFSVSCPERKVPERLEAIVFKSLHKDPAMRHQSMKELETELQEFLQQMEAGWVTNAKLKLELLRLKVAPFVGRERKLLGIAGAAVVVTALITVQYLSIYFKETREPPPGAALAWSVAEKPPREKANYERNVSFARTNLKFIEREDGRDSPKYIENSLILARLHEENGHFREAIDIRRQAYESLKLTDGPKADDTIEAELNLAKSLAKSGDWSSSADLLSDLYQKTIVAHDNNPKYQEKNQDFRHTMFNDICESLANALYACGRYGEATTYYEQLLSELKRSPDTNAAQTARKGALLCRLGDCYRLRNMFSQAETAYEQSLKIWLDDKNDKSSLIATTRLLGFVHFKEGHYKRARYLYEEALPKMESQLGESDPDVIAALSEYSQLMWKKGNYLKSVMTDFRVKELQSKRQRTS